MTGALLPFRFALLVFAEVAAVACGSSGCATARRTEAPAACDASAMVGSWESPSNRLVVDLVAEGCAIRGSADNRAFRHIIEGTYDADARTMTGTIRRTTVASGCVTVMKTTWVATDPRRFTMAIVGTDGACDLPPTYNEVSTFVRQCGCGKH